MLFGHHFAAIAGAGPLIGPVLAAQFGYAPGLIWLVGGVCLAGAVHDMIILWASTRRGGASLADIARSEIGPVAGTTAAIAILFIIIIALAGLGLAVVNALEHSAWGTFTIGMSIPLALFVGWYMYRLRPGRVAEATIIGVAGLLACVVLGKPLSSSSWAHYFLFDRTQLVVAHGTERVGAPGACPTICPRSGKDSVNRSGTVAVWPDTRSPWSAKSTASVKDNRGRDHEYDPKEDRLTPRRHVVSPFAAFGAGEVCDVAAERIGSRVAASVGSWFSV